jgi:hypothetical protein
MQYVPYLVSVILEPTTAPYMIVAMFIEICFKSLPF